MKYFIYTIKDELNGYLNITLDQNDATAERNFKYAIQNDKQMYGNKGDFSLWCLGEYDTDAGIVKTEERKILNGSAVPEVN